MSVETMTNYSTSSLTGSRLLAAYLGDIRIELTKITRTPAFFVPTLFFPAMFYVLFGVLMGGGDAQGALHTFVRMGVFGTMAPGLFGFGVSLAFEREYGQLIFKQALPTPPGSYLLARMLMAMLFASVIAVILIVLALTLTHAPLTPMAAVRVFFVEVLGVLPFCAIGLFVGALASGQAAQVAAVLQKAGEAVKAGDYLSAKTALQGVQERITRAMSALGPPAAQSSRRAR